MMTGAEGDDGCDGCGDDVGGAADGDNGWQWCWWWWWTTVIKWWSMDEWLMTSDGYVKYEWWWWCYMMIDDGDDDNDKVRWRINAVMINNDEQWWQNLMTMTLVITVVWPVLSLPSLDADSDVLSFSFGRFSNESCLFGFSSSSFCWTSSWLTSTQSSELVLLRLLFLRGSNLLAFDLS